MSGAAKNDAPDEPGGGELSIFTALVIFLLIVILVIAAAGYYGSTIILGTYDRDPIDIWPDQFQLIHESVSLRTSDGVPLKGWFIPARNSSTRTILVCHGWGSNKGKVDPNRSRIIRGP